MKLTLNQGRWRSGWPSGTAVLGFIEGSDRMGEAKGLLDGDGGRSKTSPTDFQDGGPVRHGSLTTRRRNRAQFHPLSLQEFPLLFGGGNQR